MVQLYQLVAIRLVAMFALELYSHHLHDTVHPLPHDPQSLVESVDVCCRWGVTVGPHGVVVLDFAATTIDSVVDVKGLVDRVVALNARNFGADQDEGVARLVDLRQDAAKHDGESDPSLALCTETGL